MSTLQSSFTAVLEASAPWSATLGRAAAMVVIPLAYLGIAAQVEATLSGRHGVRLLQPARDLQRALRKGAALRALRRPRALLAALPVLAAGVLAPLLGSSSPLAFSGDLAVLIGLLALYHRAVRAAAPLSGLQLVTVGIAVLVGSQVGLHELAAGPRGCVGLASAAAALLALLAVAAPDRRHDVLVLDRTLVRHLDGLVAAVWSSLAVLAVPALARGGLVVHLLTTLAIAATVGAFAALAAPPRPAARALCLAGAAACEGLAVALHFRGCE